MNYHTIEYESMLNGSGIRAVLFVSGCSHKCPECHNPQTWDVNSGKEFDTKAMDEIIYELNKPYVAGLTLSGGDPLNPNNLDDILHICTQVKYNFGEDKNIWIYTGYTWEELMNSDDQDFTKRQNILYLCDVLVDGKFDTKLADVNYPWAGSTNQRVINISESLKLKSIVLL